MKPVLDAVRAHLKARDGGTLAARNASLLALIAALLVPVDESRGVSAVERQLRACGADYVLAVAAMRLLCSAQGRPPVEHTAFARALDEAERALREIATVAAVTEQCERAR